jgi:hypothetical protein
MQDNLERCSHCGIFIHCGECNSKKMNKYYKTVPIYVPETKPIYTKEQIQRLGAKMLPRVCEVNEMLRQEIPCVGCQRQNYKPVMFEKRGYAICITCGLK